MAFMHFIPKIEWKKGTLEGTTSIGSAVVTGIANTDSVQTGAAYNMFFEGTGIPAGAVVLSKTVSTVTLDKNATANATNTFSFGHRIEFELPPKKDPVGEQPKWTGTVATSKSGQTQYIEDYVEIETKLEFSHITQAIKDKFEWFLLTHCLKGNTFSYFQDKGEPTSELVVEKNDSYSSPGFKIITRKGAGFSFLWGFKLELRRIYTA
jgi:hypothetical protein